jgi:hypothetical protein
MKGSDQPYKLYTCDIETKDLELDKKSAPLSKLQQKI